MPFYRVNAATIYSVAHDTSITADERKGLIAQLLRLMTCDTPVSVDAAQREVGGAESVPPSPTRMRADGS
jgi:hypothetical protein